MKNTVLVMVALLFAMLLHAQEEEAASPKGKRFAGGNFGLSIGRYTLINLSPQIGYQFNNFLAAGGGLNLLYASEKVERNGIDYSKSSQGITGLNLFARLYPAQTFFVQVQPEVNYIFGSIRYYQPPVQTTKLDAVIVPSFLAGAGVALPSGNGAVLITAMYDLLQRSNSPYGSQPIVNVGYNFSF